MVPNKTRYTEMLVLYSAIFLGLVVNAHFLFFYDIESFDLKKKEDSFLESKQDLDLFSKRFNRSGKANVQLFLASKTSFDLVPKPRLILNDLIRFKQRSDEKIHVCMAVPNSYYIYFSKHIFSVLDTLIYSLVPSSVMAFCSVLILIEIKSKTNAFVKSSYDSNKSIIKQRMHKQRQVFWMLIANNLFFIFCSVPFSVVINNDSFNVRTEAKGFSDTLILAHILVRRFCFGFDYSITLYNKPI
jgi:hypothetical protein